MWFFFIRIIIIHKHCQHFTTITDNSDRFSMGTRTDVDLCACKSKNSFKYSKTINPSSFHCHTRENEIYCWTKCIVWIVYTTIYADYIIFFKFIYFFEIPYCLNLNATTMEISTRFIDIWFCDRLCVIL